MTRRQKSRSKGKVDESSGDELADTAILYNVPQELARFPSSHSLGTLAGEDNTRPKSSKSAKIVGDDTDKPLPPIPLEDASKEQKHHQGARPALVKKTANMRATNTKAKRGTKPKISPPILQKTTNTSISVQDSSRPTTGHTTQSAFVPQASTAEAADLSRKISTLMAQAAAQEEHTSSKTEADNTASVKVSPLERSKNAFVKATRAIKERISNGSIDRPSKPKKSFTNRHSSFQEMGLTSPPHSSWQYEILNGLSREKLDRRIAEGENLSNPKIQSLTGDGSIPRKPLPVYESMRSRSMRSESAEDPFMDGRDGQHSFPPQDYSGFNFNLSKQKDNDENKAGKTSNVAVETNKHSEKPASNFNHHSTARSYTSRFSNMISGLAQHSDTMYFSSSPLSHSTPRARLETRKVADDDNQSGRVLTRTQSVLDSSNEDLNTGMHTRDPSPQRDQARLSDGSSLSIKRKEATADLRSQLTPSAKKAKTNSAGSKEDLGLVARIGGLATGDQRAPLLPKDVNAAGNHPVRNVSKWKGMSIFDVGKGKAPENKGDEKPLQKARSRSNHVKRSSVTRPNSSMFHYRRESGTGTHQLAQADEDKMDIDELQSEDAMYQVGGKKR